MAGNIIKVPQHYPTIKEALDAASSGDVIVVSDGVYVEGEIWIMKPNLTLIANGSVIVDGGGSVRWVFYVIADNTTIKGFKVQKAWSGWPAAGIVLDHVQGCIIENNTVEISTYGIYLHASSSNTIIGNVARFNTFNGIYLWQSNNNILVNNTSTSNGADGIHIGGSDYNIFTGNHATNNEFCGIITVDSFNSVLIGNTATNNDCGILLSTYGGNVLRNNSMTDNRYNFGVAGGLSHLINDIDSSNLVNGKTIYYLINQHDISIDSSTFPNPGYIAVINSTRISIRNIFLTNNVHGIFFAYVTDSTIENVNVTNNEYGIWLFASRNNTITGNLAIANSESGIYLSGSHNSKLIGNVVAENMGHIIGGGISLLSSHSNIVMDNTATNNSAGIFLQQSDFNLISRNVLTENRWIEALVGGGICLGLGGANNNMFVENTLMNNEIGMLTFLSRNNTIYHNNFINNTQQILTGSQNDRWDAGYPEGGNYWSDYDGTDTNRDGIGDSPHEIAVNQTDHYPLMRPYRALLGDVNGDNTVNIYDIVMAAAAYGTQPGDPNWNPFADLAWPWKTINIYDLVTATKNYGKTIP